MNEWPSILDEDAREEDIALAKAIDLRDATDEHKAEIYAFACRKGNVITIDNIPLFGEFLDALEAGLIPRRLKTEDGYVMIPATWEYIVSMFWLDRKYFPIEIILGICAGTHCPLDCHEYNPKQVEVLDAN